ncbi:MAG TPA: twin-arginine translocase TatA/TatE family subunit [Acidiphilium sp.]
MGFDSPIHWLIVIAVIALLFGGARVGNLMGELGKGIKAFKQNVSSDPAKPAEPAAPPVVQARVAEAAPAQAAPMQAAPMQAAPMQAAPMQAAPVHEAAQAAPEPARPPAHTDDSARS